MPADYGYINARVRGLRSQLLGTEFYNEALGTDGFKAFVNTLSQTPYLRDLEEAQARHEGLRQADDAVARNFYRTTRSILNFSDGDPRKLIVLLLMRYDLQNLKTIARAKHAERDVEDVRQALLPAGELKPAVLDSVAEAADLPAAASALAVTGHPLARAFSRAVSQYASDGDLYQLELSLDRGYYRVIFAELEDTEHPSEFYRYLQREVDVTNIRTIFKVRGREGSAELFVPGGKEIRQQTFEALLADESLQALADTSFSELSEAEHIGEAEEKLRAMLDRSARRLSFKDPLDIGIFLTYLRAKEEESARLRLLARGKFYGVARAQLEKELGHG